MTSLPRPGTGGDGPLWLHFYHLGGSGQELEAQLPPDEVAVESGIEPLVKFAKALEQRLEGILAHCRYPLHTSVIERINNKIKVLKRMAYGFRDDEYFFLRIRAAFPGIP